MRYLDFGWLFYQSNGMKLKLDRVLKNKKAQINAQEHRFDIALLILVVVLCLFGILMVYDASVAQATQNFHDKYYYLKQQLVWMVLGMGCLGFFLKLDYHFLKVLAVPGLVLSFLLLILVSVPGFGVAAGGAHRWLKIGGFTLQPTEIIKLTSVIFFASLFTRKKSFWPFITILGVVVLIVTLLQKDLGSAVVYTLTSLGMYFLAGAPLLTFAAILPGAVVVGAILIASSSYRKHRILAFFDPFADTQGFSYHISQILIALGSGGIWGLGLGQSRQKFNFIPEVTTDSIFSVVGEELGFIGALALILVFGAVLYRAFQIVKNSQDELGKLLAAGITLWIGSQVIVNLAAMVSLIPLTGVPLPFISYGGSALLANLLGVGVLLNISKSTIS